MACSNCGSETRPDDAFCSRCGHDLLTKPTCPECGNEDIGGSNFCRSCGARLTAADPGPQPPVAAPVSPAPAVATPVEMRRVPSTGMDGWTEPDPSSGPVARLEGDSTVNVGEVRGAWALVTTDSGWSGWVDGRLLLAVDAPGTPPPQAADRVPAAVSKPGAGITVPGVAMPVALVGGIAAIIAAFLPWISFGGSSEDGLFYPVNYLIDYETTANHDVSVGLLAILLGVAVGALAVLPARFDGWRVAVRPLGVALLVVGAGFLVQTFRLTDEVGIDFGDVLAVGPFVVVAAGILALIKR